MPKLKMKSGKVKHYPYTAKGRQQAKAAAKRMGTTVKSEKKKKGGY